MGIGKKKAALGLLYWGLFPSAAAVLKEREEQHKEQGVKNDLFSPINPNKSDFFTVGKY